MMGVMTLSFVLLLIVSARAAEVSEWRLAGREGECVPLSTLAKKGPEFRDVRSPYQLVERMRAAGHKTEIKEHKAGSRPAVEVRIPSQNLYIMFVKSENCNVEKPAKN
jgi:hypothetical protein